MVLVQKWPFFPFFFLGNIGQENVFDDIVETKNAFLGYIKKVVEKAEKLTFSLRFGPKMAIFPSCFFQQIYARKMSFMIF